jgi:four helix bundle protein
MDYKELIVWQKAHALTLKIIMLAESAKRSYAGEVIIKQSIRAVTSIGANIAEGYGRQGKEYVRFLKIAYSSANELDNWLTVLKDAGLMQAKEALKLLEDNKEIIKMLTTMINKLKRSKEQG